MPLSPDQALEYFQNLFTTFSIDELDCSTPPKIWFDAWTPENGCAGGADYATFIWNQDRADEVDRRRWVEDKKTKDIPKGKDALAVKTLLNYSGETVTAQATFFGVAQQTIYRWTWNPTSMPKFAVALCYLCKFNRELADTCMRNATLTSF